MKKKILKTDIEDILSLSSMQEGMLFHYLNEREPSSYIEQISLNLAGLLHIDLFKKACQSVVKANEMLRSIFRFKNLDKPVQVILKEQEIPVNLVDISAEAPDQQATRLQQIKEADRQEKFDLETGPLLRITVCKLAEQNFELIINNHHIIYDGWSNGIILKELFEAYDQLVAGKVPAKPAKAKFKEFIKWTRNLDQNAQKGYWMEYLQGFDLKTSIPTLVPEGQAVQDGHEQIESMLTLPDVLREGLEAQSQHLNITLSTFFYVSWGILLQKYNNITDVLFGSTVSGRSEEILGIEKIVGLFINTIPLRINCPKNTTAVNLLETIQADLQQRRAFENTPLVDIKSYSELGNQSSLFDTILVFENYPLDRLDSSLQINSFHAHERTNYDLTVIIDTFQGLKLNFIYNTNLFSREQMERLMYHYQQILHTIVSDPTIPISQIDLLSADEKDRIITQFNSTKLEYSENKLLHQLLEEQAVTSPDAIAVVDQDQALTYQELNERANQLARHLRDKGVRPNEIVGVMVDRSIEMTVALWAILKAGGAYLPISPAYPEKRLHYILEDSNLRILLTQNAYLDQVSFDCEILDLNDNNIYVGDETNLEPLTNSTDLAYIIYTSGSTGQPKGVMIEHKSVINVLTWMQDRYQLRADDIILQMTAFTFDVSVWELFWWAMVGARVCFLPPHHEKDPEMIVQAIENYQITTMHFVPSMLNTFLDHVENFADFEQLQSLNYVFASGEALKPHQLQRFNYLLAQNNGTRLFDLYGPTEATIYASYYDCPTDLTLHKTVPIGRPIGNTQIYILDKYDQSVPIGVPGELCIAGDGLARGYWNKPELTKEKFVPNIFEAGQRMYRTGDLARWLPDGQIEFLGRIDYQVKIRGLRIELDEIDFHLANHEAIKDSIVVVREDQKDDLQICAYYVADQELGLSELRDYLLAILPDYMVPAYFVRLAHLPLNPNGKVDRKALPKPEGQLGLVEDYIAPRNEVEAKLATIWSEILGIEQVGVNHNFFDLGGHSLKVTSVIARVFKEFDVEISFAEMFKSPTIQDLAQIIQAGEESIYSEIQPVEEQEYYPLSSAQKRLFLLNQIEGENTSYNMPGAMVIEGDLDPVRLETSFRELIQRHESLRTSFEMRNGEPVQRVHEAVQFKIDYLTLAGTQIQEFADAEGQIAEMIAEFVQPFDLGQAPLLRVKLIKVLDRHVLIFDMHHIISDGTSLDILVQEVGGAYSGSMLPNVRIQYKDFSVWQNNLFASEQIRHQEEYWLNEFAAEVPVLNLPTDYSRPATMTYAGDVVKFELGEELTAQLNQLANQQGATMYMVLLAAYNILLAKYSGQEDIIVGSPIAGRPHADLEQMIGMFVNTLALRNYPQPNMSFAEFLTDVKERALQAYEHQDYQFEMLVEKLNVKRDLSRSPLFDVMFVLQNEIGENVVTIDDLQFKPYELKNDTSKFDLTLYAMESMGKIKFKIHYSTDLFQKETIERLQSHLINILAEISEQPQVKLADLRLLAADEQEQLLTQFNQTVVDFPREKGIHHLFEEQVEKTPDKVALYFVDQKMTYQELNEQANRLARVLKAQGVQQDEPVGILFERSMEMIVGMLAVLKAGAAYLPIDSEYPSERIGYMLNDSGAKLLLSTSGTGESIVAELPKSLAVVYVDQIEEIADGSNLAEVGDPQSLAYIIYTSGSTGTPKGVGIEQHSLVNYVSWFTRQAAITNLDATVLLTSFAFDLGYTALWTSLVSGAQLHIVPENLYKDPHRLLDYLAEQAITYIKLTPSLFKMLVNSGRFADGCDLEALRTIVLGGEQIRTNDLVQYRAQYPTVTFMNHYGPTEATIGCVSIMINDDNFADFVERPVIGRPNSNMGIYILDQNNRPVPVGVPGELCITGEGLARGYINRPEMTEERFIPNPFAPNQAAEDARTRLYKTGDLARWLSNGTIEFMGRIDQQIKIRGFRVEIGEIESQLLAHQGIKEVAVIAGEDEQANKYLVAYFVADEQLTTTGLRKYLLKILPDYMIPSYFVQLDQLPVTPNGKLDRKALPDPHTNIQTENTYVAPATELEEKLVAIWQKVLSVEKIGVLDNFFDLGGHSLKATDLIAKLYKELNVEVPLRQIFVTSTIRELAEYLGEADDRDYLAIPAIVTDETALEVAYPVSSAQRRLYILDQIENLATSYNMPAVMLVHGELSIDRLQGVLEQLIQRHESLRTSFRQIDGEISQVVHREVAFTVEEITPDFARIADGSWDLDQEIRGFIRPFNLDQAPLLRVGVLSNLPAECQAGSAEGATSVLIFDMHHIISDGVSRRIIVKEVASLFADRDVPELRIQYKDFSAWQNELFGSEKISQQEEYWLSLFADEVPVLNIPTDYARPAVMTYTGDVVKFEIGAELTAELNQLAKEHGATLYMVLLAAYNILLAKYSGQRDIIVGSPIAGRPHADLENIIGMFVNTLAMRNFPEHDQSFGEFLADVRERAFQAYENQDYQFEMLVKKLDLKRDLSRNPLFDAMFVLQNTERLAGSLAELDFELYDLTNKTTKFDLSLIVEEDLPKLNCSLEYRVDLFKASTIQRLAEHFGNLLKAIVENSAVQLRDLELTSKKEQEDLLLRFNHPQVELRVPEITLHQLFEEAVARTPEKTALVYQGQTISYDEFNTRSNQLARLLREKGIRRDEIVAIMVDRSFEMMIGIMGILKAGGAYLPINPDDPEDRRAHMLADSQAKLLLTHNDLSVASLNYLGEVIDLDDPENYLTDGSNLENVNQPADLAYIIYTSGSTGMPKGVMVEHRNVINLIHYMDQVYPLTEEDAYLLKTAYTFDVSVSEIFGWFLGNGRLVIPAKGVEKDAKVLLETIVREKITHLNFVPSMLNIIFKAAKADELLALNHLKYVFVAGEAISKELVKEFYSQIDDVTFENLYGPTEATIYATKYALKNLTDEVNVPIGEPLANVQIYILDEFGKLQPIGVPGELYIAGAGVTRGYLNREELTAERFVADPFVPGGRMYKTGDLARWLADGNIEFLGRIDNQVKIRGFRIELGEIENQLLKDQRIKEALVVDLEDHVGDKYLCGYLVTTDDLSVAEIKANLATGLPDYMIPTHLVKLAELPKTSSGKLDRKSLPQPDSLAGVELQYTAPTNEVEEQLATIWSEILGIDKVGIDNNFFELGGHSLKVTSVIARVFKEFQVEVSFAQVFKAPTIRELAQLIASAEAQVYSEIQPVEEQEYYPLSSAQKRLFLLNQIEGNNTSYNMPGAMIIEGDLDRARLKTAFETLIERHESLRTTFEMREGELVQRIHEDVEFASEFLDLTEAGFTDFADAESQLTEMVREFIQPFELSQAPLLRVRVVKVLERHLFMFDMHHIISDGTSLDLLVQEIARLYAGEELPELRIQYKDFSAWQNKFLLSEQIKEQEAYWLERFAGEIPELDLVTDYPRSVTRKYEGERFFFTLDADSTAKLNQVARENDATLYMVLLALYNVLLAKYSGQEDIIVGSPTAGRPHTDLENIIGMFVNTLAMRNFPEREKRFTEFLAEVKDNSLKAYENQDYQFEMLIDKLALGRGQSRNPLFNVMFSAQTYEQAKLEMAGLKLAPYQIESNRAKFDLTLTAMEEDGMVQFGLEYSTDLFRRETMERFSRHLLNLIQEMIAEPEKRLADFGLIDQAERERLLVEFNNTAQDYPKEQSISELFEEQVQLNPEGIAVVFGDAEISYRELNQRANQLARTLRGRGVGPDVLVGMMVHRSIDMIIGIMGILKAGGAYLPIDPEYPLSRIEYMLADSEVQLLLTHDDLTAQINFTGEILDIKDDTLYAGDTSNLARVHTSENLAYVIYTSGTTGNPKGNLIRQYSVTRVVKGTNYIEIRNDDKLLQLSNYAFDGSVFDIYGALLNGAKLVMIAKETLLDLLRLAEVIREKEISVMFITTALFNTLVDLQIDCFENIRKVLFGGERISVKHAQKALEYMGEDKIIHVYGPTETTVFATYYFINQCDLHAENIPIGTPLANTEVLILDPDGQLQPIGVAGELCISGVGLAKGYLNRPDLTAEKFVQNPFRPGERLYKTGDLARWLADGNIEFLGRVDDQVKIRGFRIELGEIEAQLLQDEKIKSATVMVRRDDSDDQYLCAYLVTDEEMEEMLIRTRLEKVLPEYMIPTQFVFLDQMPLTINGKINKKALPAPDLSTQKIEQIVPPRSILEDSILQIWKEVLGKEHISIFDDFFVLGGHSLKATRLVAMLSKELNVNIKLKDVFERPTIAQLAELVGQAEAGAFALIEAVEPREYYPVSSAQKRLYVLNQLEGSGVIYNMPGVYIIDGPIDLARLQTAFTELVDRHETLRTSFGYADGELVQIIHQDVNYEISVTEIAEADLAESQIKDLVAEFIREFDLHQAPLIRVGLIVSGERTILIYDMHHIISDGVSMNIIINEVMDLYAGKELPELRIQYKDFSAWQNQLFASPEMERQEAYWLDQLLDDLPVLELPLDYPRPVTRVFTGDSVRFAISEELSRNLNKLALSNGSTLYMVLLAAFKLLLSKYSQQTDLVVGSPISGRTHADLNNIVGMFVNTLAMRTRFSTEETFTQLLLKVKETALQAYDHQDYQFETLVGKLNLNRDLSRNPIFDVMFVLQNGEMTNFKLENTSITPYQFENQIAKFDLTLNTLETDEGICGEFQYCTGLFKRETIERLTGHFLHLLNQIVTQPAGLIADFELITPEEREQILLSFNDTDHEYPTGQTIQEVFELAVAAHGEKQAVVFGEQSLTYRQLNQRANRLARVLRAKGARPEMIVGVMAEPSVDLLTGILAILKAGSAYLPIDPLYPPERIQYMLTDSESVLLVTESQLADKVQFAGETILLDETLSSDALPGSLENIENLNTPDNLAYVIYTSGSTGKPKGALIEHQALVHQSYWFKDYYQLTPEDRSTKYAGFGFDVSVIEIFPFLISGVKMHIIPEELKLDLPRLNDYYEQEQITIGFLPTAIAEQFMKLENNSLRCIFTGGDKLKTYRKNNYRIFNNYGPTENTVTTSCMEIDQHYDNIPIGKPIANTKVYILNQHHQLQPIGVPGELCVSGIGLARGYLNNPELTAKKFVQAPFGPTDSETRMYRTGDLARWLPDGSIEFIGRVDHQVKIRGYRIELGEIETQLLQHPSIQQAAVITKELTSANKVLVAYYLTEEALDQHELKKFLQRELPEYMIPAFFIKLDQMPLTKHGKIDRKQLPDPMVDGLTQGEYVAPRDENQEKLAQIWAEILGVERVGITDDFYELGGDSIKAIQIVAKAKQQSMNISVKEIFKYKTVVEILENTDGYPQQLANDQGEVEGEVWLTPNQQQFLELGLDQSEHGYQTKLYTLPPDVDVQLLEKCFQELVSHHDALRISFQGEGEEVAQFNRKVTDVTFKLHQIDLSADPKVEQQSKLRLVSNQLLQDIDLAQDLLIKAIVFDLGADGQCLQIAIHHLISDESTWPILLQDLETLYRSQLAAELPLKTTSYQEWSHRVREYATAEPLKLQYWEKLPTEQIESDFEEYILYEAEASHKEQQTAQLILDQVATTKLLTQVNHAYSTTTEEILLAALTIALANSIGVDGFISVETSLRENIEKLDLSRTIGRFSGNYPIYLVQEDSLKDTIIGVKESLRRIPNQGLDYLIGRYLAKESKLTTLNPQITFRYLPPQSSAEPGDQESLFLEMNESSQVSAQGQKQHNLLEITGLIRNDQLHFAIMYQESLLTAEQMNSLVKEWTDQLRQMIEHCAQKPAVTYTPADFKAQELFDLAGFNSLLEIPRYEEFANIARMNPLTSTQTGMLFHSLSNEEGVHYHEQTCFYLEGDVNVQMLSQAWQEVVNRHEILRTDFVWKNSLAPTQIVLRQKPVEIYHEDYSHLTPAKQAEYIARLKQTELEKRYDFEAGRLSRLILVQISEGKYFVSWTFHHILLDGWSVQLVIKDFFDIYHSLVHQLELPAEPTAQFGDYLEWLQRQNRQQGLEFWRKHLQGLTEPTLLPADKKTTEIISQVELVTREIGVAQTRQLEEFCRNNKITINTLIQTCWGLLLQRYNNTNQSCSGMTVSGRPAEITGEEQIVGLFINTLLVAIKTDEQETGQELLTKVNADLIECREYQYLSLTEVEKVSDFDREQEIFNTLVVFENYPISAVDSLASVDFAVTSESAFELSNYDLTITATTEENLKLAVRYNADLFTHRETEQIITHFTNLIFNLVANPDLPVSQLEMLSKAEQERLLVDYNATHHEYRKESTIQELFEAQVAKAGDQVALVLAEQTMTYHELNQRANQVARVLRAKGVTSDTIVGLLVNRSFDLLVGMLGILKAGGAYLPIDPEYPEDRINFMLTDSKANLILTNQRLDQVTSSVEVLELTDTQIDQADGANLEVLNSAEDLAYVIYTSGSTGKPKGVMIEHRSVNNFIEGITRLIEFTPDKTILSLTTVSFDIFVLETILPLTRGCKVVIANEEEQLIPEKFNAALVRNQVNMLQATPSRMQLMLSDESQLKGMQNLQTIMVGGEAFPEKLLFTLQHLTQAKIFNMYGPTETTIWSTVQDLTHATEINIGQPIANTQIYILDHNLQLVTEYVDGDLYIAGDGLSRGYLGREELTQEKFIDNPYQPGTKMYKTGDLARWLPDGHIEFVGRADHQVKIRGFRIEPGEIENQLTRHQAIREAVVIDRVDQNDNKYLCAYLVTDQELSIAELREHLLQELPDYMVPAHFMNLPEIPLTPNGKINRKALPEVDGQIETGTLFEAPENEVEERLVKIWAEILQIEKIGVNDKFFEIGGDSLKTINLLSAIKREFGVELQMVDLFKYTTIRELAELISPKEEEELEEAEQPMILEFID